MSPILYICILIYTQIYNIHAKCVYISMRCNYKYEVQLYTTFSPIFSKVGSVVDLCRKDPRALTLENSRSGKELKNMMTRTQDTQKRIGKAGLDNLAAGDDDEA